MSRSIKIAAFALAVGMGTSAFAVQLTQNFDSAPADWIENGSRTAPQNFGFSNTNNAGGTAGEAGGTINRNPLAYYHTAVGTIDPSTQVLTMSGLLNLSGSNTNELVGWHDVGNGSAFNGGGTLIGFRVDNGRLLARAGTGSGGGLSGEIGPTKPNSFTVTYDPTGGGADATLRVQIHKDGVDPDFDQTFTIPAATRDAMPDLTHFGIATLGASSGSGVDYYDNFSYTSAIPEPATLSLLGLGGGLLALRRRNR